MIRAHGCVVRPDGACIYFRVFGATPPSVCLVHGWMASSRVWTPLLAHLPGVSGLVVDLRGAGESSRGPRPLALDVLAEDLLAVVTHTGLAPLHLVGHSMGGQVAQLAAARRPDAWRSLTLVNPVPTSGLALPDEVAARFRGAGGVRAALDAILSAACRELAPADRAAMLSDALRIAPAVVAEGFDAFTRGAAEPPHARIAAPTLVLATDDPFLPVALLRETVVQPIRAARLAHLPGPGHYPMVERPGDTARLLLEHWGRS